MAVAAPAAHAQFSLSNFTAQVFADDARDTSSAFSQTPGEETDPYSDLADPGTGVYDLAGGHPYIGVVDFSFTRVGPGDTGPPAGQNVARLRTDTPTGLQPSPEAFAQCTDAQLEAHTCPLESQIGTQRLRLYIPALAGAVPPTQGNLGLRIPLYNMTPLSNPEDAPQHDVVARFAFHPAEAAGAATAAGLGALAGGLANLHAVHIVGGVRDEPSQFGAHDNGLFFTIDHLPARDEANPASPGVLRSNLTFWGVPGDPTHDDERAEGCVTELPSPPFPPEVCVPVAGVIGTPPDPEVPFLTNPTQCEGQPLVSRLTVWSHPYPGAPEGTMDTEDDLTPTIDGKDGALFCENLPFAPALELFPDTTLPDTPSGPKADLLTPQPGLADKDSFTTSHVKDVSVTLPEGMTLNPSLANGLETCTDAQFAANTGTPGGEACPAASRIGDSKVITPVLVPLTDDPSADLAGSAYVGSPIAGDKYRLFVTLEGRQVSIRLKGSVKLNPSTGQVTATFPNNPQLPFSDLGVDFRDGPRAPVATPLDCGAKSASAVFTAWSGHAPVTASSAPFAVAGDGCPAPFFPTLSASTANPSAGAYSTLSVGVGRRDRNQFLKGVRVEVPPGFAGFVSRVSQCPQGQAVSGACPASSRIGSVDTAAGAGAEPYQLTGQVYLTERYARGSSFGLVSVVRAIAGPYDLGTVVVRQSIFVDPDDGHISVTGDDLPRILDGVPIRLRLARVNVDRSRFAFNPTACGPKRATGRLDSVQGSATEVHAPPVQIVNCEALPFAPRLAMRLTGNRAQTKEGNHPGIKAVLKNRFGRSNVKRARVTLPRSLALDPENARALCSYERGLQARCPVRSRIGRARVVTPVLNRPLRGKVFFVQGIRFSPEGNRIRTLPSLLVKLRGEVRINLRATSSVDRRSRLVSTFSDTPDLPFKRFEMVLKGGRGGILAATGRPSICGRKQVARVRMNGHNGKARASRLTLKKQCRKPGGRRQRARS